MTIKLSPALWLLRLFLAALLFFGGDLVLWQAIPEFGIWDWIVRLLGYPLLATLILDVAQRYRIRDAYDAMVLIAGAAILHSLTINPTEGWAEFLGTLLTRVIGAEALSQLILWGIFLACLRGNILKNNVYQIFGTAWLGFFWGTWMRWSPELRGSFEAIPLETMLSYAAVAFALPLILYFLVSRFSKEISAQDVLLSPLEWGIALVIALVLYIYQAAIGAIDLVPLMVSAFLFLLIWAVLLTRREAKEISMLEKFLPLKAQIFALLLAGIAFGVVAAIAYQLPLIQAAFVEQLWLMEIGFFVVGLLWLPLVAAVIATRAFDRLSREGASL